MKHNISKAQLSTEFSNEYAKVKDQFIAIWLKLQKEQAQVLYEKTQDTIELMKKHQVRNAAVTAVQNGAKIINCCSRDGDIWYEVDDEFYYADSETYKVIEEAEQLELLVSDNHKNGSYQLILNPNIEYW